MKPLFLALAFMLSVVSLGAQQSSVPPTERANTPVKQWTASFTAIDVDANIKLTLIPIAADQAPYIVYDTKDGNSSKFSAVVEKGEVLKIRERTDPKHTSTTEVAVYYNTLADITIAKADTFVNGVLDCKILDITISNHAKFVAKLNAQDLDIVISGNSCVELSGDAVYHTADVTSSQYNATGLVTMSSVVEAHHNAEVRVNAEQRLVVKSTTGGKVMYKSQPEILRVEKSLFGVDVEQIK